VREGEREGEDREKPHPLTVDSGKKRNQYRKRKGGKRG